MRRKLVCLLTAMTLVLGVSLAFSKTSHADDKIKVVTTFYPVYEFTKEVMGDEGDVSFD